MEWSSSIPSVISRLPQILSAALGYPKMFCCSQVHEYARDRVVLSYSRVGHKSCQYGCSVRYVWPRTRTEPQQASHYLHVIFLPAFHAYLFCRARFRAHIFRQNWAVCHWNVVGFACFIQERCVFCQHFFYIQRL